MTGRAASLAIALAALIPAQAPAQLPQLPGLGPDPDRTLVDPSRPPWRGLARIRTELGGSCTGFLVAPAIAMTAAHCLYLPKVGQDIQPRDVHLQLRADRGALSAHARVRSFSHPPGWDPHDEARTGALDRAVLVLDHPVGHASDIFHLAAGLPPVGARLMLGGYGQDRIEVPVADLDCHFLGASGGVIRHDCAATSGDSGAPLLAQAPDGTWAVIGLAILANGGARGGYAAALVPQSAPVAAHPP